jgi:predicted nucleic acid-binding protein
MKVFIDTGGFCSIVNKKDQWYKTSSDTLQSLVKDRALFFTSNFILSETYTLIRFRVNYESAIKFMDEFQLSNIKIIRVSQNIEEKAKMIFKQYQDKTFSFIDCTSFALIDARGFDHAFTLDSHFCHYRFKSHVTIVPEKFS